MEREKIFEVLSEEIFIDKEEVLNYFWELIKEYLHGLYQKVSI